MNPYSLFLSLLFFLPFNLHARNLKKEKLATYFQNVHQAAIAICKGEMDKAKGIYYVALTQGPYSYYTDLNNAIYAEIKSSNPDTSKIINYLKVLQTKGLCVHEKTTNIYPIQI